MDVSGPPQKPQKRLQQSENIFFLACNQCSFHQQKLYKKMFTKTRNWRAYGAGKNTGKNTFLKLPVIWVNWAFKCVLQPIFLRNLRVAWSTGSGAGAGCAELGQRTGEQVYMLEKRHRWKKSMRRKPHLVNPPSFFSQCVGEDKGYERSEICCV